MSFHSNYVLSLNVALAFLQVVITVIKYMPQVRCLPKLSGLGAARTCIRTDARLNLS